jgi:spore maturation protein CgeB
MRLRPVKLPRFKLPEPRPARPVKAAVILDDFSDLALRYEWEHARFGPDDWHETLTAADPDLLFVESAWHGNGDRWRLHLTRDHQPSTQLRELVAWCRQRGIPTVFWNKEDPPNYDVFLETARLFDQVFTVDAERIQHYQRDLGHDRIDLLPFAAQPRIHNPIRRDAGRVYDVAFAGTWFAEKHSARREQLEFLLDAAGERVHIWSRMQKVARRYRFPKQYARRVVGSLPYERMLAAYTAYRLFLNVNSVTESKTMGARRLFELSAAQTPIVSAPAASIEPFFGDTVTVVTDEAEARTAIDTLLADADLRDRLALRAHRRVYDEHLYTHRVESVLASVGVSNAGVPTPAPGVSAIVPTRRPEQLDHVLRTLGRQTHRELQVVLVTHGWEAPRDVECQARRAGLERVVVLPADSGLTLGACLNLGVDAADGELVAKFDDDNLYFPHYLTDLVRALDFSAAQVAGKWAHHVHLEASGANLLRFEEHEHRYTRLVQGGTLLLRRDLAARLRFEDLPRRVDTTFLEKVRADGGRIYSSDRFNFVSVRRADPAEHTWTISDAELLTRSSRLRAHGDPTSLVEA